MRFTLKAFLPLTAAQPTPRRPHAQHDHVNPSQNLRTPELAHRLAAPSFTGAVGASKIMSRLLSVLVLAVNVAAWDECHFPHVDYIAHDEGVGKSAACASSTI